MNIGSFLINRRFCKWGNPLAESPCRKPCPANANSSSYHTSGKQSTSNLVYARGIGEWPVTKQAVHSGALVAALAGHRVYRPTLVSIQQDLLFAIFSVVPHPKHLFDFGIILFELAERIFRCAGRQVEEPSYGGTLARLEIAEKWK